VTTAPIQQANLTLIESSHLASPHPWQPGSLPNKL
jgi:hypothetical protein